MFRVLGIYNFGYSLEKRLKKTESLSIKKAAQFWWREITQRSIMVSWFEIFVWQDWKGFQSRLRKIFLIYSSYFLFNSILLNQQMKLVAKSRKRSLYLKENDSGTMKKRITEQIYKKQLTYFCAPVFCRDTHSRSEIVDTKTTLQ